MALRPLNRMSRNLWGQGGPLKPPGMLLLRVQHRFQSANAAVAASKNFYREKDEHSLHDMIELLRTKPTAWTHSGSAQFDFRSMLLLLQAHSTLESPHLLPSYCFSRIDILTLFSGDVVTRPTLSMLKAVIQTTLQDDVYREDPTTISLENYLADITGHQAGIFVISGTMSNQLALRTHLTQPPHAVLCDSRAHIIHWEAGGVASLSGAMVQGVNPGNGEYLKLEDIQRKAILSDDVHKCPTAVISLENTVSGLIHPLSETRRISRWARQNGLKLHLDGARLWEAVAAGAGSLREYAECFDSVALDFSKGLGAPTGAVIVGNEEFVTRARRIRKGMGGGMRQAGVLSSAARAAVGETFGEEGFGRGAGRKLRIVHEMAKRVTERWTRKGGKLKRRTETNVVWVDLDEAGLSDGEFNEVGRRNEIKLDGCRIVLHYQISDEALRRLDLSFDATLSRGTRAV
jgi:threonine aldolase